jgi:hypothetical protein
VYPFTFAMLVKGRRPGKEGKERIEGSGGGGGLLLRHTYLLILQNLIQPWKEYMFWDYERFIGNCVSACTMEQYLASFPNSDPLMFTASSTLELHIGVWQHIAYWCCHTHEGNKAHYQGGADMMLLSE